jgi:uncharacterized membrane protein (DUF4010 family)
MNLSLSFRLAIALALGLIIGIERGWERRESTEGERVAGIRSFSFVALLGGLAALLAEQFGVLMLAVAFAGFTLIVVVSYGVTSRQSQRVGITTELSLLITFVLGALAVKGFVVEALAASVVVAVLLGFKAELHQILTKLDRRELLATLQLLLIAAVALPLLPDQNLGPWNALNPRAIGLIVLLIAGLSYLGYFAMRLLGSQVGLLATAALGGLVSSTAVTISFARMARKKLAAVQILGAGISLAAGMMALRILIEVIIVNPALLPLLVVPISLLAVVPLMAVAGMLVRKPTVTPDTGVDLKNPINKNPIEKNPIELGAAIGYGAMLSGLFILIRAVEAWLGNTGIYLLAAISGITDVDAVSLSLAQSTKAGLPLSVGATGILIAAMVNTVVKALLASIVGGWHLGRWCATILFISLGLALIPVLLLHL